MSERNRAINVLKHYYKPQNFLKNSWNFLTNVNTNRLLYFLNNPENSLANARLTYRLRHGKNAPLGAHTLRNFKRGKLPNRIFTKNNVLTNLPKKGENFRGRRQTYGTCWYQSILNGWMLSDKGRIVMKHKLRAFKQSHEMKPFTNMRACPMRGKIPSAYFWSYVDFMFRKSKNKNFYSNVMRGIEFPEPNLIRSSHMRSSNQNITGGSIKDIDHFNEFLFGPSQLVVYSPVFSGNEEIPSRMFKNYILSHAVIFGVPPVGSKTVGHGIAGYISRGRFMVFDSNSLKPVEFNWTTLKGRQKLTHYFMDTYKIENPTVFIKCVYIQNSINAYKSKPEMSFNFNTLNNKKSINRYPNSTVLKAFREIYNTTNFANSNKNNIKNYLNKKSNSNKMNTIRNYVRYKNMFHHGNKRVKLRRWHRMIFGTHAPSNMSNDVLLKKLMNHFNKK